MNLTGRRSAIRSPLLAVWLVVVFAGTALATPAAGFHPTIASRSTLMDPVQFNTGEIKFQTKGPVDFVTITVAIDPLGSSGWLSRPGVVLASVVSGTIVLYNSACVGSVLAAGSAFVVSGDDPVLVRNESATTPAAVNATFVVPAGTPNSGLRIDRPNPGCPQS